MSNFSPKLKDSTEDQLNFIIEELDARYGALASNELLRRSINKLQETIELFNKEASKQTNKMLVLTYKTTFLTAVMLICLIVQIILAFK